MGYALLATGNVTKTFYTYGLNRTMYPDQGFKTNVFSTLPALTPSLKSYVSPYAAGNFLKTYLSGRDELSSSTLAIYRNMLHNTPFLFPYERVEIPSYGPYTSVSQFITLQLFITSYFLKLKHTAFSKTLNSAFNNWSYASLNVSNLLGYTARTKNSGVFFKTYSNFVVPFFTFINFYGSESRMFFYMFFQHVRHRKVLE